MRKRVLIIGYGNTLRGDDGIGRIAAEMLATMGLPGVRVVSRHQLTPEIAEDVAQADRVVFVDAVTGSAPGCITIADVQSVPASMSELDHHMRPGELLMLAARLYAATPSATLVTVGVAATMLGEGLSEQVARALPELIATLRRLAGEAG